MSISPYLKKWTPMLFEQAQEGTLERFFDLVVTENRVQNLTRILSEEDFVEGHLVDVEEFLRVGWSLTDLWADLGAGGGLPGIPLVLSQPAALRRHAWLIDSEKRKAQFLERVITELALEKASAVDQRFETWASKPSRGPSVIISRAVGKIGKLLSWVENCSTWNNLILLKGPGWDAELADFMNSSDSRWYRERLEFSVHSYELPVTKKIRKLVRVQKLNET